MPALSARFEVLGADRLRWGKYSSAYRGRLSEGGKALQTFLAEAGISWDSFSREKSRVVDELLEQFVKTKHSQRSRSSLRLAKHAVLAVQIIRPRLRHRLQAAWNAIKSWEEQRPSNFRAPVPLTLLMTIVCRAMLLSEEADRSAEVHRWRSFGALVLVGFFGLLRPGELLGLKSQDAVLPNTWSLGSDFAVIRLNRPKNSRQMGIQQYVEIRHPDAINWLSWLKSVRAADSALWDSAPNRFRSMFKRVCADLCLGTLHLSPASLRAGGATWLVDEGMEIGRIRFLGRWSRLRSLEHYIQVARAQQITLSISPAIAQKLKKFLARFHFLIHLPAFLACDVPSESLVATEVPVDFAAGHAISGARAWGRLASAVSKGGDQWRPLERSEIH